MIPAQRPINVSTAEATLGDVLERVALAETLGCDQIWLEQQPDERDALIAACEYLRAAPSAVVGTGVLPIYARHPVAAATSAMTLGEASGGRFALGLGYSHYFVNDYILGQKQGPPLVAMREYLAIVRSLLDGGNANVQGEHFTAHARYRPPRPRVPLVIAALRPGMIRLAAEFADGMLLWLCPTRYIKDKVMPAVYRACEEVGRDPADFDVIAPVSSYVGPRPDEVSGAFFRTLDAYRLIPLYRQVMEYGGLYDPHDLAIIGTEAYAQDRMEEYRAAGVTPAVSPLGDTLDEFHETVTAVYGPAPTRA
jgi:5,10-methylenetetrahydromethanopterin reductase